MKQICVSESAADSDAESFQRRFEIKVIRNVKNLEFSPPKIIWTNLTRYFISITYSLSRIWIKKMIVRAIINLSVIYTSLPPSDNWLNC